MVFVEGSEGAHRLPSLTFGMVTGEGSASTFQPLQMREARSLTRLVAWARRGVVACMAVEALVLVGVLLLLRPT